MAAFRSPPDNPPAPEADSTLMWSERFLMLLRDTTPSFRNHRERCMGHRLQEVPTYTILKKCEDILRHSG